MSRKMTLLTTQLHLTDNSAGLSRRARCSDVPDLWLYSGLTRCSVDSEMIAYFQHRFEF